MLITIDTTIELSDRDLEVLRALVGKSQDVVRGPDFNTEATTPQEPKAEPAPVKRTRGPNKPKPAPEPEPEPEVITMDEVAEPETTLTKEELVKRATEMVSRGQKAEVRSALDSIGVERAGLLTPDKFEAFSEALDNAAML